MTTAVLTEPAATQLPAPVLTLVPLEHPSLRAAMRRPGDEQVLHRAVMSLFPDGLPGRTDGPRAAGGILHRLDIAPAGPARLLVQHACALRGGLDTDPTLQHVALGGLLNRLRPGTGCRFRVVLNAVRCQTGTGKRVAVTDPDELVGWGLQRLAGCGLTHVELADAPATALTRGRSPLWTARFDGHAQVADPDAAAQAVRDGIGRAKAYGCGLLSLLPQG